MSDWFSSLEWVPTLRPCIETAHVKDDGTDQPAGYYIARWADKTGLLRWIHADGDTREDAAWNLIEMAPDMLLFMHNDVDEWVQKFRSVEPPPADEGGEGDG